MGPSGEGTEAKLEKVEAAERDVALVRAGVIGLNIVVYVLLMDKAGTIPWLAYTVAVVAGIYALFVLLFRPYEQLSAFPSSIVTSTSDAALIVLWIWATGGFASPFYVLWYVSIVAIAFRYPFRETLAVSVFYAGAYVGLLAAIGDLGPVQDLVVRSSYIVFVGALAGLVSLEAFHQTEAKVRMRSLMREARAAETRFRRLVESAPDAMLITDVEGRPIVANSRAEDLFGYDASELLALPLDRLVPGLLTEVRERDEDVGLPQTPTERPFECQAVRADGGRVPVEASVSPIETPEGPILSASFRDVTERKRAEQELARRAEELARSNAELEQFAYVASHDLQEPLRMVASYVQLLQRRYEGELDEDADAYIGYATEGVERMRKLINDLLAFSQVGSSASEKNAVDTREVVAEVLDTLSPRIEETHAEIEVGELPVVLADRSELAQLFQNLVSNAIKFHGDDPPGVEISAQRRGNEWVFSVEDNGIGISPEHMDKIFVLFQRLHSRATYDGTGIGLAICKKIVERHGGRIWCESGGRSSLDMAPAGEDEPSGSSGSGGRSSLDIASASPDGKATETDPATGDGTAFRFTLPVLPIQANDDEPAAGDPSRGQASSGPAGSSTW